MSQESKEALNIALITPYMYLEMYYYLSLYGNVYIQTYDEYYHGPYLSSKLRLLTHGYLHGIAGYIGWKLRSKRLAKALSRLFNPPHTFQTLHIPHDLGLAKPENIDLVIVVDLLCNYNLKPFKNAVKVYWAIDSFYDRRIFMYETLPGLDKYDLVFVAHEYGLKKLRDDGISAEMLPLALRYEWIYRPLHLRKEYDVVFIGRLQRNTHSRRMKILNEIKEKLNSKGINILYTPAWHSDAARLYNKSRIVLNITRAGEINLRLFEALGTRSFVLNDDGEVRLLFQPSEHVEVFSDVNDAVEKIYYYLVNEDHREKVASNGFNEVIRNHTMYHRVERILQSAGFKITTKFSQILPFLFTKVDLNYD